MRENPYRITNVETGETVAWCTYQEYILNWADKPGYDMRYQPGRKKK